MKTLFVICGILFSVTQMMFDTFNQLQLPTEQHMKVGACLMLALLILDGVKRYFDPEIQTKTLWVTISMFVIFVIGGVADHMNWLTDLGVPAIIMSYMRLAFSIILITLNKTIAQLGNIHVQTS